MFDYIKVINFCVSKHKVKMHHILGSAICNTGNWQRYLGI